MACGGCAALRGSARCVTAAVRGTRTRRQNIKLPHMGRWCAAALLLAAAASLICLAVSPERPEQALVGLRSRTLGNCTCADPAHCAPIDAPPPDSEVFAYYLFGGAGKAGADLATGWAASANWSVITTVAAIHAPPDALICAAHAHGRRAVFSIDPGRSSWFKFDFEHQLQNTSARTVWVRSLVAYASQRHLDGVNLDIEDNLGCPDSPRTGGATCPRRAALTALTAEVSAAFRAANPHAQVSFSTRIETRKFAGSSANFDYPGLAAHTSFFFVMGAQRPALPKLPVAPSTQLQPHHLAHQATT